MCRVCVDCVWNVCRVCVDCVWNVCRVCVDCVWNVSKVKVDCRISGVVLIVNKATLLSVRYQISFSTCIICSFII